MMGQWDGSVELELDHGVRRLGEEEGQVLRDALVDHHHGQGGAAEELGVDAAGGRAEDLEQLAEKGELRLLKGGEPLGGQAAVDLLLFGDGEDGHPALRAVGTLEDELPEGLPPGEGGVVHQGAGALEQPGLLIEQGFQHQLLFGGEEGVEEGLGDAGLLAEHIDGGVNHPLPGDGADGGLDQRGADVGPLLRGVGFSGHGRAPVDKVWNEITVCIV